MSSSCNLTYQYLRYLVFVLKFICATCFIRNVGNEHAPKSKSLTRLPSPLDLLPMFYVVDTQPLKLQGRGCMSNYGQGVIELVLH